MPCQRFLISLVAWIWVSWFLSVLADSLFVLSIRCHVRKSCSAESDLSVCLHLWHSGFWISFLFLFYSMSQVYLQLCSLFFLPFCFSAFGSSVIHNLNRNFIAYFDHIAVALFQIRSICFVTLLNMSVFPPLLIWGFTVNELMIYYLRRFINLSQIELELSC